MEGRVSGMVVASDSGVVDATSDASELPGMSTRPGPYSCPCGRSAPHKHGEGADGTPRERFTAPITGKLTTSEGSFDIYGPMLGSPTWIAYPAGANRKARRRLDTKRRKAERKRGHS